MQDSAMQSSARHSVAARCRNWSRWRGFHPHCRARPDSLRGAVACRLAHIGKKSVERTRRSTIGLHPSSQAGFEPATRALRRCSTGLSYCSGWLESNQRHAASRHFLEIKKRVRCCRRVFPFGRLLCCHYTTGRRSDLPGFEPSLTVDR